MSGPEEASMKWFGYRAVKQPSHVKWGKIFCNLQSSGSTHIAFHDQQMSDISLSKWSVGKL